MIRLSDRKNSPTKLNFAKKGLSFDNLQIK